MHFVRFYGTLLPIMFTAVLLLALGGQLTAFANDGECLWIGEAIFAYSKPFYMVPVAVIIHTISNVKPVAKTLRDLGVPPDDMDELAERDLWIQVLPIMLGLMAWLVTILHCYMAHYALAGLTHTVATMRLYYLSVDNDGNVEKSKFSFYFLLAFIYMWLIIINAPCALVWAKGLHAYASVLRKIIYFTTVTSIPYCLIRMYRINVVISIVLTALALTRIPALVGRLTRKPHTKEE
nr:hypothetical protein BaRGS_006739 [Batillaria attramentaria]